MGGEDYRDLWVISERLFESTGARYGSPTMRLERPNLPPAPRQPCRVSPCRRPITGALLDHHRRAAALDVRLRTHIPLLLDAGYPCVTISAVLFCSVSTISRWKLRFEAEGPAGLGSGAAGSAPEPRACIRCAVARAAPAAHFGTRAAGSPSI